MKHELMTLPYTLDALSPLMSKETLEFHYNKHHQTYVNKLNDLIDDTEHEDSTLIEIVKNSQGAIFNNAAQVYNHDFFWNGLSPNENKMSSRLEAILIENFSSIEEFKKDFVAKALGHFGSGWVWLVLNKSNKLEILTTVNANTPICDDLKPLLVCDVWEHAYYIDVRNARPLYVENFWKLINWNFVESNLS